MFKCIGIMFLSSYRLFNIVDILAKTGEAYAQQFEVEALAQLEKKREVLRLQDAITIEATP